MNDTRTIHLNMAKNSRAKLNIPEGGAFEITVICNEAANTAASPEAENTIRKVQQDVSEAAANPTKHNTNRAKQSLENAVNDGAFTAEQRAELEKLFSEKLDPITKVLPKDDEGNLVPIDDVIYDTAKEHFGTFFETAGIIRFSTKRFFAALLIAGVVFSIILGAFFGVYAGIILGVLIGIGVGVGFGFTSTPKKQKIANKNE